MSVFRKGCISTSWMISSQKIFKNQKVFVVVSNIIWIEKSNCECMHCGSQIIKLILFNLGMIIIQQIFLFYRWISYLFYDENNPKSESKLEPPATWF